MNLENPKYSRIKYLDSAGAELGINYKIMNTIDR